MTVLADREEAAESLDLKRRNRFLVISVVLLGVVAIGLGFLAFAGNSGSAPPADVMQVVDDYNNAILDQDPVAWEATITDDWYYGSNYYGQRGFLDVESSEPTITSYKGMMEFYEWSYEPITEAISSGDGPWIVTMQQRWINESANAGNRIAHDGFSTYVVIDQQGVKRVSAAYWTGSLSIADS